VLIRKAGKEQTMDNKTKNPDAAVNSRDYRAKYEAKMVGHESLVNIDGRKTEKLNGRWRFLIDPRDTIVRRSCFEKKEFDEEGRELPKGRNFQFSGQPNMDVPSCWNMAAPELFYYDHSGVYIRSFAYGRSGDERCFLHFEGAQYRAYVFLNRQIIAVHDGGSTPFSVEITDEVRQNNELAVVVDAARKPYRVPMDNTDWFNYGGLYRDVELVRVPATFIKDWSVSLVPGTDGKQIEAKIWTDGEETGTAEIEIEALQVHGTIQLSRGYGQTVMTASPVLWDPENPMLYGVRLQAGTDSVSEKIGFRELSVKGHTILLNGKQVYLKGISVHEDHPTMGKCETAENIRATIAHLKQLHGNFLRLAHYPHSRLFSRIADEQGVLLWEEIPVYWAIDFTNPRTYADAENQLQELILRDRNRASVIIWSVGNENADSDERLAFMGNLVDKARSIDPTRAVSAACLVNKSSLEIDDRLADRLDIVGINEYYGWYDPDFSKLIAILRNSAPTKPVVISEFGAEAVAGHHGTDETLWTEEFQATVYRKQFAILEECPYIQGTSPWILYDFRSEKRFNDFQQGHNRKGIVSEDHVTKKQAFGVVADHYATIGQTGQRKGQKMKKDYHALPEFNDLDKAIAHAIAQTDSCLPAFELHYKYFNSQDNWYIPHSNESWTSGFWPGELWLAYEQTGNEKYKKAAQDMIPSFLERIETHCQTDHHDMGFIFTPSCVSSWKLTGNEQAKKAALLAADNLCLRFHEKGQFLQCWGPFGDPKNNRFIIDCLLNLPLLFWAYDETGIEKYDRIARAHLDTAVKFILRPDHSTYQSYFFDPETGAPLRGATHQGYSDESAWARGQSWGIYGAALAYRYTKEEVPRQVFRDALDYFLDHLPEDIIPYWDLRFDHMCEEPKDSSALAISICGMLEMSRVLPASEEKYKRELADLAGKLCKVLYDRCAVKDPAKSNGQLLHGTAAHKSPYNTCRDRGVDECTAFGDYFYVEALMRLKHPEWDPYW
jgi:beta-glucuronidase